MRVGEILFERRERMLQYLKSIVPTWPDYVVKDWLYAAYAKNSAVKGSYYNFDNVKELMDMSLSYVGLDFNSKWQLVPNMKFTMDMWEPDTKESFIERAGGKLNPYHIPKDAERHATQSTLSKKAGGVSKEPVIMIKTSQGYQLLEGWHRTIQHFVNHPEGFVGPAYVAQGK